MAVGETDGILFLARTKGFLDAISIDTCPAKQRDRRNEFPHEAILDGIG
jgi:hypothetical protein